MDSVKNLNDGLEKIFWLITENDYSELRKIDGCKELGNLDATIKDGKHMISMADAFGIPRPNQYIDIKPTAKRLNETMKKIRK